MRQILRCGVIVLGSAGLLAAQRAGGTGWTPVLQVRALQATPQGTIANLSSDWNLGTDGEPLGLSIWTGNNLCDVGIARADGYPANQRNVWSVTGEYLGEQGGRHQVRVASRFRRLSGRDAAATAATTQTLELREGDNVTLDALTEEIDARCKVHALTIDARLIMQPADPALARARYTADLWLVHDGPESAQMREHLILNIDGTAIFPFVFKQMTFALPLLDPRQGGVAGAISLSGSLRARTRTDGLVDLDVDTNRMLYGLSVRDGAGAPFPQSLRKTLTLKRDETTAIDFPPPTSGYTSVALSPGGKNRAGVISVGAGRGQAPPPGPPVEVKDDRLVLNTAEFFKGHKTQMLITLRKLPKAGS